MKSGVHAISLRELLGTILQFRLEAPDVMRLETNTVPHQVVLHWNEAEGFVRYHEDGTQTEFEHGKLANVDGWDIRLPTEKQAEKIIELLRELDGVEY